MRIYSLCFILLLNFSAKALHRFYPKPDAITISAHLKSNEALILTYYDDYLVNQRLIFNNQSKKDSTITQTITSNHILEFRYSIINGSTNESFFTIFYAKRGDQIHIGLQGFVLKNLGNNNLLFISDFLALNDSMFAAKNTGTTTPGRVQFHKEELTKNLKKIDALLLNRKLTDSIASLWKEAARNFYYLKLSRLKYSPQDPYLDTLFKALKQVLSQKTNLNSTFLNAAMYSIGNYRKIKNSPNFNLKSFVEEIIKINTEKRYKTGIVYQALNSFPEKTSKLYLDSYALFDNNLNDAGFRSQNYAARIIPVQKSFDKTTIKLITTDGNALTLADVFKKNKGKFIFVDFWASWCVPCIYEFPYLEKAKTRLANKNIVFVSLSLDLDAKGKDWKNAMLKSKITGKNQFRVIEKSNKPLSRLYQIEAIPKFMVFNENGMLLNDQFVKPSDKTFEEKLLMLLSPGKPGRPIGITNLPKI
ncbi:TlpA family protein disulfide reductase [Pedobacter metabolipauper]|uniref:Thiol-disulfide isomerase/thioredoxin n=1 Tax=Pedobacter metabolipauper TaxID=425513 RepID=A0A4R6T090_9SPHI|nr:TlpA disulfide reductase family protein [Pedobacter metabolipauper]TDQ11765.1 thiol-disulfide isomerase/thioredoxin [Pedobacter metabolipauper]